MKVAVSFLSSKYDFFETIKRINESSAYYIHTDIMDGKYVEKNTFDKSKIKYLSKNKFKKCDVHLLTINPSKYLKYLKSSVFEIIYFHPKTEKNVIKLIAKIKKLNKKVGIVINPDEDINEFMDYFNLIDYVLIMSVNPGAGGQTFLSEIPEKIDLLTNLVKEKKYKLQIAIDGGINDDSIKYICDKKLEYVVSGSYICQSNDFESKISSL